MSVIVSSPGKIHLLGEHAVVYGKPALLAAIDKRLYVKVRRLDSYQGIADTGVRIKTSEGEKLIFECVSVFKKAFVIKKFPPLEINVSSNISTGSGLGSSAALSASVIGALMKSVKNIWNPVRINELAFEVEKTAHGNPSGADNTTVVFGGLVWYRREFDFLKSIWSLPLSPYKIPPFFLIDSGRPKESTKEMVESVGLLYKRREGVMESVFSDQELQTKKLLLSFRKDNRSEMIEALKRGERNLEKMGVVGVKAYKIIREIEGYGGAAKICGAGGKKEGSGMILCCLHNKSMLQKIAQKYSASLLPIRLGEEGIRVEQNN
ncbi:hypothetical protein M1271_01885 [Patescibacteria group bacterium]|nr:hypothetical protein [Patescibacteria group bacterium]MCL5798296.1 hypothetical protein [Patescibacteria group bacterium]